MKAIIRIDTDFLYTILYKLGLDYMYVNIQFPLFGYNGFENDYDVIRMIIGWLLYIALYVAIRSKESDTSSLFTHVVFFISIVPFITLYQYNTKCGLWMLIAQCVCLIYINCILNIGRKWGISRKLFAGINYRNRKLRFFVFVVILGYFMLTFLQFGVPNLQNLFFEEVYNTRLTANLSVFQSILQNVLCRIICPISLLIMFREKKWIFFTVLLIVQIYTYAVTGFKTYLFISIFLIGLQFLPNLNMQKTIIRSLPFIVIGLTVVFILTHNSMLYAVLGNRVFFLPAIIKYAYFDFFNENQFVYFTQNSISRIFGIQSNYGTSIVYLIGQVYFNKPNMWTNTGFMAEAYANLGFLGMILLGTILAIVLNILVKQLKFVPSDLQKELQAVFVLFYISLNDGAAISVLFSGGMLFAVMVVCFVKFYAPKDVLQKELSG